MSENLACQHSDSKQIPQLEDEGLTTFKLRLSEIADLVEDQEKSLDEIFELYEESLDIAKSVGDILSQNATRV